MVVITSLSGGGAERAVVLVLEHADRARIESSLVIFEDCREYAISEDVPVLCLHKRGCYDLPRLVWRLARLYDRERPDTVLSFMDYPNLVALLARKFSRSKPRVVLSEQFNVGFAMRHERLWRVKARAVSWLYPQASRIVTVSDGVADDLVTGFGVPRERFKVIHNPVDLEVVRALVEEDVDHPWFTRKEMPVVIAAGRLVPQKNYPLLLRAFARAAEVHPSRLVILGQGRERDGLEKLAEDLGIEGRVAFLGFQANPFKYLARSDVFVLSSLWEGVANVLPEAMACGVPVVSTRCPSGPDEVITHGVNGLLVPMEDEAAMTEAILCLLDDGGLSTRLVEAGRKRAEDFAVRKIVEQYEAVL